MRDGYGGTAREYARPTGWPAEDSGPYLYISIAGSSAFARLCSPLLAFARLFMEAGHERHSKT